ncbi:hypothetical protein [Egbenema bharatensis]|uniref:hypothetical protein n=1 Tax=Egbenema bharatensis TaxID=3463334 RepID=UPI003A8664F3
MEDRSELIKWVVIWVVVCAVVIRNQWNPKTPSAGLPFAYLLNLTMIHWAGGLIYTFPWYNPESAYLIHSGVSYANVAAGFKQSVYGVIGFGLGSAILAPWLLRSLQPSWLQDIPRQPDLKVPKTYLSVGLFFFSVLTPILSKIPGLTAVSTSGVALVMVGLCLTCWKAWLLRDTKTFLLWIGFTCIIPLITVVTMGFIGYGAAATTVVLIFVFSFYRPRWKVIVIGLLVFILGLSVFVTYFRDRNDIRDSVWGGDEFDSKIEQALGTFRSFEIIDPFKQEHLEAIDIRLNQNTLVGQAVHYMQDNKVNYAMGETLWFAAAAVIPRVLWPGKPAVAGSGNLVSQYTGVKFAQGTSVGIGQVMEFYINFGAMGVILGFLVFGMAVRIFDMTAGYKLLCGNWTGFATWFLPGLGMLQPGGALSEVAASVAASIVFVNFINRVLFKEKSQQSPSYPDNAFDS